MFYAYSKKFSRIMNVTEITDLSDEFSCCNENCSAKFFVKGLNSHKAAHFCKKPSTSHAENCPYASSSSTYIDSENLVKTSLERILEGNVNKQKRQSRSTINHCNNSDKQELKYIRTPKALLTYCLSNDMNTLYLEEMRIKDFFVSSQTLSLQKYYYGIKSTKLILGKIMQYDDKYKDRYTALKLSVTSDRNSRHRLTLWVVITDKKIYKEIINYLFNTFDSFSDHPIAVLGSWEITEPYTSECVVSNPKNIIYKFAENL